MNMLVHIRPGHLVLVAVLAFGLSACESTRKVLGLAKQSPDESGVTVFSPLVVPPDFNLRPPGPGTANNRVTANVPRRPRQGAVITDDGRIVGGATGTESVPQDASVGELALLRQAGALTPPAGIRGLAAQQELAVSRLNRILTDVVLFDRQIGERRQPSKQERSTISKQGFFSF